MRSLPGNAKDTYWTPLDRWNEAIREYSPREMTYESDRLPAISGLASFFANNNESDEYLAGLWRNGFPQQLMWRALGVNRRYRTYVAPTWSWASQSYDVFFAGGIFGTHPAINEYTIEAVGYECKPVGQNPYGAIHPGHIILEGICDDANITVDPHKGLLPIVLDSGLKVIVRYSLDCMPLTSASIKTSDGRTIQALQRAPADASETQSVCSGHVRLLWINPRCFLILAYSKDDAGAFERLGIGGETAKGEVEGSNYTSLESRTKPKERLKII